MKQNLKISELTNLPSKDSTQVVSRERSRVQTQRDKIDKIQPGSTIISSSNSSVQNTFRYNNQSRQAFSKDKINNEAGGHELGLTKVKFSTIDNTKKKKIIKNLISTGTSFHQNNNNVTNNHNSSSVPKILKANIYNNINIINNYNGNVEIGNLRKNLIKLNNDQLNSIKMKDNITKIFNELSRKKDTKCIENLHPLPVSNYIKNMNGTNNQFRIFTAKPAVLIIL